MKKILTALTAIALVLLISVPITKAAMGVGVGTGKIIVDELLKPGTVYELPVLTVINTGDEGATYGARVAYHQDQEELSPPEGWFNFSPRVFDLEPDQAETIKITLAIPLKAEPGKYFAYLEGFPVRKASENGETAIGIAAAAKLYFEVEPASYISGIYYRALSLWRNGQPWTNRGLLAIVVIGIVIGAKKFFNIEVNVKTGKKPQNNDA